jgi:class 3 adenylate cyclase
MSVEQRQCQFSSIDTTASDSAEAHRLGLRAIMFTDIVGSTSMTERLGDARSVEMVRAHDAQVRRALKHVVKNTGDGIMASFADTAASVNALAPSGKRLKPSTSQARRSFRRELVLTSENRLRTATIFLVRPSNSLLVCAS